MLWRVALYILFPVPTISLLLLSIPFLPHVVRGLSITFINNALYLPLPIIGTRIIYSMTIASAVLTYFSYEKLRRITADLAADSEEDRRETAERDGEEGGEKGWVKKEPPSKHTHTHMHTHTHTHTHVRSRLSPSEGLYFKAQRWRAERNLWMSFFILCEWFVLIEFLSLASTVWVMEESILAEQMTRIDTNVSATTPPICDFLNMSRLVQMSPAAVDKWNHFWGC